MNPLPTSHASTSCSFSCLYEESKCNQAIQIVLAIITVSGLATSVGAYFSYLPPLYFQYGIGVATVAVTAVILFRICSSNELNRILNKTHSFSELQPILERASLEVLFFGSRVLRVPGIKGTIAVDNLAVRVEAMVGKCNFTYSETERSAGSLIEQKITSLFQESHKIVENRNCLTRFFYSISNPLQCLCFTATIEARWLHDADRSFDQDPVKRPKQILSQWLA